MIYRIFYAYLVEVRSSFSEISEFKIETHRKIRLGPGNTEGKHNFSNIKIDYFDTKF